MIINSPYYIFIYFFLLQGKIRDLGIIIENQINKYLLSTYYVQHTTNSHC